MDDITIRSGDCEISIEQATGRVCGLRNKNTTFIKQHSVRGPLRLHMPYADFEAHIVEAHTTHPQISSNKNSIDIRYENFSGKRGATGIGATITIRAVGDGSFELTCEIRNAGGITIPQVFFPFIGSFHPISLEHDQVMFGKSNFTPWTKWQATDADRRMSFMDYLSMREYTLSPLAVYQAGMKWMDYGSPSCGVSLFSREKTARTQLMRVSSEDPYTQAAETIDLSWVFYPYIEPGNTWQSPTFVLYPHEGDWHRGVLKFREYTGRAFKPVPSTAGRDATVGQYTLWISWHYQDWKNLRYRFKDIPAIASEARKAGFREMTLARATELDFCLPIKIRRPLGTSRELKAAVEESRRLEVNITPFVTCDLIRENTVGKDRHPQEWFKLNVAGQRCGDNWTYDPGMTPRMPIDQIGSRAAYYICAGSKNWRKAYFEMLDQLHDEWGYRGLMFDVSFEYPWRLCFNPLHTHKPDQPTQLLNETLAKTRELLAARFGEGAALSGESQWDASTEWMDFTWDWFCFQKDEPTAPFHMAFPRARQCMKCTDYLPQINRIFTAGYWLDMYLEDGGGRLGDYPDLTKHLASLADFKARFSHFFNRRDVYLHTMGTHCDDKGVWIRSHRYGDEVLVLVTQVDGKPVTAQLQLDPEILLDCQQVKATIWLRTLEKLREETLNSASSLQLNIGKNDFLGIQLVKAL